MLAFVRPQFLVYTPRVTRQLPPLLEHRLALPAGERSTRAARPCFRYVRGSGGDHLGHARPIPTIPPPRTRAAHRVRRLRPHDPLVRPRALARRPVVVGFLRESARVPPARQEWRRRQWWVEGWFGREIVIIADVGGVLLLHMHIIHVIHVVGDVVGGLGGLLTAQRSRGRGAAGGGRREEVRDGGNPRAPGSTCRIGLS